MVPSANGFYEFGPFCVDTKERLLLREGQVLTLTPKAFDTLLLLVENGGHVLTKEEMMSRLWPDTFVEEANLTNNISLLRKALGETQDERLYIQTVPRVGYRFVASVREVRNERINEASGEAVHTAEEAERGFEIPEAEATVITTDGTQTAATAPLAPVRSRQRLWRTLAVMLLLAAVALVAFFASKKAGFITGERTGKTQPSFHRLTFRRGIIGSARFASDGQTIVYGAMWEGDQLQLFSTRPESSESRPVGLRDANILAISSSGEMAISLHPSLLNAVGTGTLARMPFAAGAPREVLRDVKAADWSSDGTQLAVIHNVEGRSRLEFPIGKVLYETKGRIGNYVRISPKGDLVAFSESGSVAVVDLTGKKKILSSGWQTVRSLAWSSGDEVWFTASEAGYNYALHAVTLSGQQRLVWRVPGELILQDISRDGRVLLERKDTRKGIMVLPPGEEKERDLSWLDWGHVADLSADGKSLLFYEPGEGNGASSAGIAVYLRKTDGGPAVRLGDGEALSLSPDGKLVLSTLGTATRRQLMLLPTGAGESKPLTDDKLNCLWANWFPDGRHVLLVGNELDHEVRCYILDIESGNRRPITAEGIEGELVSPDGKFIITFDPQPKKFFLFPLEGGKPRPIPGFPDDGEALQWSIDGRSIYVRHDVRERPARVQVYQLDLSTGRSKLWKEFMPDPAGAFEVLPLVITPDGRSYAYTYGRGLSDLYLVEGLK